MLIIIKERGPLFFLKRLNSTILSESMQYGQMEMFSIFKNFIIDPGVFSGGGSRGGSLTFWDLVSISGGNM